MNILLHVCCAPCLIHPFRELSLIDNNSVTGFFYNPNIHPFTEFKARLDAAKGYSDTIGMKLIVHKYDMENFFKRLGPNIEPQNRCGICWRMRLHETALYAKENGFDAFASTLLVSPYQSREDILKIGWHIADEQKIEFVDRDWRPGFKEAQAFARENNIYRQKYCGCVFSEKERYCKKRE